MRRTASQRVMDAARGDPDGRARAALHHHWAPWPEVANFIPWGREFYFPVPWGARLIGRDVAIPEFRIAQAVRSVDLHWALLKQPSWNPIAKYNLIINKHRTRV